ncbi:trace amine-associated receptor 13c-like [Cololabis saira]|uniref:trace amine-associated receptor 13c-like n=1 Tax=Cololabis saira TaxID=129043 RepID=UPI002AD50734|nr:trace amine-associated receptor 13c-like [Cololabis saira]
METQNGADLCFPQFPNISCKENASFGSKRKLSQIIFSLISLLIVALNLLVIISVFHFRQLHTPTNILLLSLAVTDFLVGLLLMPFEILRLTSCWFLGDLMCILLGCMVYFITSASVGIMVLISVERYIAICDPLHYPTRVTVRTVKLCVCLCWVCSVCFNSLFVKDDLINPGKHSSCYGECVLDVDYTLGTVDLFITFIIPVTVIVVLYVGVFVVALSHARAMRSHITAPAFHLSVTAAPKKSELKAARNLGVLIVVFLTCFCPYYCVYLAGFLDQTSGYFAGYLFYFNSCINPMISAMLYPWFRKAVKLIVTLQILKPGSSDANIL